MIKNFLKKFGYMIIGGTIVFSGTVFAVQVTVPSGNGPGFLLQSLSSGNYSTVSLIAGSNIMIATTTSSITISANGGGGAGTGTISTTTPLIAGQVDFSTGPSTIGNDSTFTFNTLTKNLGFSYGSTTAFTVSGASYIPQLANLTTNGVVYTANSNGTLRIVSTSTPTVTAPITYSGTLGQFLGGVSGTFGCTNADTSTTGCLTSTDWNTFNGKQAAGNYITALTGDVTASGPGSVAATLATVNGNVGSFTNANITVNAKGLITAAANGTAGGSGTSQWATTTAPNIFGIYPAGAGYVNIGTTTSSILQTLTVASSTASQLSLSAGAGARQWAFRNNAGDFYLATTSVSGTTLTNSLFPALYINGSDGNVALGTTTNISGLDKVITVAGMPGQATGFSTGESDSLGFEFFYRGDTNAAIFDTFGYSSPIQIDGSILSLQGNSAGIVGIATTSPESGWATTIQSGSNDGLLIDYTAGSAYTFLRSSLSSDDSIDFNNNNGTLEHIVGSQVRLSISPAGVITIPDLSNGCLYTLTGVLTANTGNPTCSSGGGGSDPFTHPFNGGSATTSVMGFGTTTPFVQYQTTIASSTAPQLSLSAGAGISQWIMRNAGGNFYLATTTVAGTATSTQSAFSISTPTAASPGTTVGIATSSPWRTLSVSGTVAFNGLTTAAGTPNSVCMDAATKEVTVNAALTCTVSSKDYKSSMSYLSTPVFGGTTSQNYLGLLLKIQPAQFAYKDQPDRLRWGFFAEDLAKLDPKLADAYDATGHARSIDQNAILAATIKAVQDIWYNLSESIQNLISWNRDQDKSLKKLETENKELKARIEALGKKLK